MHPGRLDRIESVSRGLLGFEYNEAAQLWRAIAQRPFQPRGLLLFGVPHGSTLDQCVIGHNLQIVNGCERIPAKFFAMGDSYEQIAKLIDAGKEPPAWCTWSPIGVGQHVHIVLRDALGKSLGPADGVQVVFWGEAVL